MAVRASRIAHGCLASVGQGSWTPFEQARGPMVNPAVAPRSSDDLKEMSCHACSVLATRRRCCPHGLVG